MRKSAHPHQRQWVERSAAFVLGLLLLFAAISID
jgi:hypothetical protein